MLALVNRFIHGRVPTAVLGSCVFIVKKDFEYIYAALFNPSFYNTIEYV